MDFFLRFEATGLSVRCSKDPRGRNTIQDGHTEGTCADVQRHRARTGTIQAVQMERLCETVAHETKLLIACPYGQKTAHERRLSLPKCSQTDCRVCRRGKVCNQVSGTSTGETKVGMLHAETKGRVDEMFCPSQKYYRNAG